MLFNTHNIIPRTNRIYQRKGSLKRGFGGCGHEFGGRDGLGRFGGFCGFSLSIT